MDRTGVAAFVTGVGQGIGRSIAFGLAEAGTDVALTDVTEQTEETAMLIDKRADEGATSPMEKVIHPQEITNLVG